MINVRMKIENDSWISRPIDDDYNHAAGLALSGSWLMADSWSKVMAGPGDRRARMPE